MTNDNAITISALDTATKNLLNIWNTVYTNKTNQENINNTNDSNELINKETNDANERIANSTNLQQQAIQDSINRTNIDLANLTNISNQQIASDTNKINAQIQADVNASNERIANQNLQFQKENFEYQKQLQQQLFEREDTSYQRTVNDMRNSGLSPLTMQSTNGSGAVVSTTPLNNIYQAQGYTAVGSTDVAPQVSSAQLTKAQRQAFQKLAFNAQAFPMFSGIANDMLDIAQKNQNLEQTKAQTNMIKTDSANYSELKELELRNSRYDSANKFKDFMWMNANGLTPAMNNFNLENPFVLNSIKGGGIYNNQKSDKTFDYDHANLYKEKQLTAADYYKQRAIEAAFQAGTNLISDMPDLLGAIKGFIKPKGKK